MKKIVFLLTSVAVLILVFLIYYLIPQKPLISGAPPYEPEGGNISIDEDFSWLETWVRPTGPAKVALQVGHLDNEEVPEELYRLRGNTGATGGGKTEAEVNLAIAEATKLILEEKGVVVDLLPATIPPRHWADVFVAIHADGSEDTGKTGYKVASPRRDRTGNSKLLAAIIEASYGKATGLDLDPEVTRNMKGYYAFSWWRYEHAIHPMTASMILETGFLTNWSDQQLLIYKPEISAKGLADGIIQYLQEKKLI